MLTHAEMEAVVRNGGSVLFRGRVCASLAELPSLAELGEADPTQHAASLQDLEAARKDLDAQITRLRKSERAEGGGKKGES